MKAAHTPADLRGFQALVGFARDATELDVLWMFSSRGTQPAYGLERLDESFLEVLIGWMTMSRPARRRFYRLTTAIL